MRKPTIVTGLDIGSSKICACMEMVDPLGGKGAVIVHHGPSRGIERGHIVDLGLAINSVSKVLERLEERSGRRAENIFTNISGRTISAERARGMVSLSQRGREITEEDTKRCVKVASTIRIPFESDIIHRIVHSYTIDDQTELKNPVGLYGSRLAVEIYVVTVGVNHMQNIRKLLDSCGYEVREMVFSSVADSFSVFSEKERKANVILVDMGRSVTEITVFSEGILQDVKVVLFGASDIKTSPDTDPGLDGLIAQVRLKAEESSAKGQKPDSVLIAGGASLMDGLIEAFESKLGLPPRPAHARGVTGDMAATDNVTSATAIGLARYAVSRCTSAAKMAPKGLAKDLSSKVVDIFNNYF